MNNIKKHFLIFAFVAVMPIALAYGISPDWFASTFLGIDMLDTNIAHILRAIMCLYFALGLFWLYSVFNQAYRNPALLTVVLFTGGLVVGRLISYFVDGQPQPILILYIGLEFVLAPIAYWIYRLPELFLMKQHLSNHTCVTLQPIGLRAPQLNRYANYK